MLQNISNPKILEEKNEIDEHFLDIIGNEFKFDHEKGLAEWLKNSKDAYNRNRVSDYNQYIIFRFSDNKSKTMFECIDFNGMSEDDITKAFKRWGDPNAARRNSRIKTFGGHGNGGKFYMRQMFKTSYFVTYKNGYLSIYGFNKNKKYGFANGFKNIIVPPKKALEIANLNNLSMPTEIKNKIYTKQIGFTVVKGIEPKGMKTKININNIIRRLKNHPQAQHILSRINVSLVYNDLIITETLKPEEIKPRLDFEKNITIDIPKSLNTVYGEEKMLVTLSNEKFKPGKLILKTSEIAFARNSKLEALNRIDFIGEVGVIASYKLTEIDVRNFPQAAFIFGVFYFPILEDPTNDMVKNDRTKLTESPTTKALLEWVANQIDNLAMEIAKKESKERDRRKAEISSAFNSHLNEWKNKFMKKMLASISRDNNIGGGNNVNNIDDEYTHIIKKNLIAPDNIEFSYTLARIPIEKECKITLKARVPKPIPIGAQIDLSSDNKHIKILLDKLIITEDTIKTTESGEQVSVLNAVVIADKTDERGLISASVGAYKATIEILTIEKVNAKDSGKSFPLVLLTGIDKDPLEIAPGGYLEIDYRQPLVYQRPQDLVQRIYWINTSSPLADEIMKRFGEESMRWRDYLLQRYVDIFIKEALFELQSKEPDSFTAERIDSDILGSLMTTIHIEALKDLNTFLFDERYVPKQDK